MDIRGIDKRKFIIKAGYYAVTLLCLAITGWALHRTYLYFNIPLAVWFLLYLLIAAYIVGAIIFTYKIHKGIRKVAFHSMALQIVPICATILLCGLISRADEKYVPLTGKPSQYERTFNDMQHKQREAAIRNGQPPFESQAEIEAKYKTLHRNRKLVHISTNSKYIVRDLDYSAPYVVPKVKELLDDIAKSFQEKTQSKTRFMVTSVLRTDEDVKKLRKVNGNASAASCHRYGTTIDISYVRFGADEVKPRDDYELRLALAQTLHDLRKEGRCYVKIERKQFCYHITVR